MGHRIIRVDLQFCNEYPYLEISEKVSKAKYTSSEVVNINERKGKPGKIMINVF